MKKINDNQFDVKLHFLEDAKIQLRRDMLDYKLEGEVHIDYC
jgi:hypothetical protein